MTWQVTWYEVTHSDGRFGKQLGTSEFKDLNFNFKWRSGVAFNGRKDRIGFRATTRVIPLANELTIMIGSDDGSRLLLDDIKVIDNWGLHGHRTKTATVVAILFKPAKLTYEWYEWGGYASAEFQIDTEQVKAFMGVFPFNLPPIAKAIDIVALPLDVFSLAINPNTRIGAASSQDEEIEIF